jgi:hypothetical protein
MKYDLQWCVGIVGASRVLIFIGAPLFGLFLKLLVSSPIAAIGLVGVGLYFLAK